MKFWCVESKFFDDGHVEGRILTLVRDDIPADFSVSWVTYDKYVDYFSSYEDALKHYQDRIRA